MWRDLPRLSDHCPLELAGLAEPPQIRRHDRGHGDRDRCRALRACALRVSPAPRRRCRARSSSTWSGVSSGLGMNCRNEAWNLASANGMRHQQAPALDGREHELHQLLEALHFGAAELVDSARPAARPSIAATTALGDVAGEDRLEPGMAAADQRQRRREARNGGKLVEEVVFRSEQDRGPQDRPPTARPRAPASRPAAFERA